MPITMHETSKSCYMNCKIALKRKQRECRSRLTNIDVFYNSGLVTRHFWTLLHNYGRKSVTKCFIVGLLKVWWILWSDRISGQSKLAIESTEKTQDPPYFTCEFSKAFLWICWRSSKVRNKKFFSYCATIVWKNELKDLRSPDVYTRQKE